MDHAPHSAGWPGGPGPWQVVREKAASCFLRDRALGVGCVLGCPQARNQHSVPRGSFHVLRAWPRPPAAWLRAAPPKPPAPGKEQGCGACPSPGKACPRSAPFPWTSCGPAPRAEWGLPGGAARPRPVLRPHGEDSRWAITLASARGRQGCVTGLTVFSS